MEFFKDLYTRFYTSERDRSIVKSRIMIIVSIFALIIAVAITCYAYFFRVFYLCGCTLDFGVLMNIAHVFEMVSSISSICAAIFSLRIPYNYTKYFDEKDWEDDGDRDYKLIIPSSEHGFWKGANAVIYQYDKNNAFSEVLCCIKCDNGDIIACACNKFRGKIVIN